MEELSLKFVNYTPVKFSPRNIYAILGDLNSENRTTLWWKGVFVFVLLFFLCMSFLVSVTCNWNLYILISYNLYIIDKTTYMDLLLRGDMFEQ